MSDTLMIPTALEDHGFETVEFIPGPALP